jgi:defect-in-organelle-trafficking protein DotD
MLKKPLSTLAMALSVGLLVGCSSTQKVNLDVDPGVVALSKAADEISESYRILSYAESARISDDGIARSLDYVKDDFPKAWHKETVLREDYYGELESFLRGLSKLVGYNEPQIVGATPVIPITVALNRSKKPIFEYLIDAAYQSGGRARVILDTDMNRLQITYPE